MCALPSWKTRCAAAFEAFLDIKNLITLIVVDIYGSLALSDRFPLSWHPDFKIKQELRTRCRYHINHFVILPVIPSECMCAPARCTTLPKRGYRTQYTVLTKIYRQSCMSPVYNVQYQEAGLLPCVWPENGRSHINLTVGFLS